MEDWTNSELPSKDPRILEFLFHWKQARKGAVVPKQQDIDPAAMSHLLGMVWLYRFDQEVGDFVCRLAGEDINTAWGRSIKRLKLRDIVGEADHAAILARWRKVIDVPQIEYASVVEHPVVLVSYYTERILLPVSTGSSTPDSIFGLSLYRKTPLDPEIEQLPNMVVSVPCSEV